MRPDLDIVASLVEPGFRVLDLGCGDGELLEHLIGERGCSGSGVEISSEGFHACVARGVPVRQGDIDEGLDDFADGSFDAVILSLTLQATHRPAYVLEEMARVGRRVIVSFPNFGEWRLRGQLATRGRMPVSRLLPARWHETKNIHLCTISDFEALASELGLEVDRRILLGESGARAPGWARLRPNLIAAAAVYSLHGPGPRP